MDNRQIGRFIAECRKEKGLTQRELGERLHVTDRAVSKWETGKSFPDVSILEDVCRELDISVSELLAGKRIESEDYKEETEKVLIATIGQRQLMGFEVVCSILKLLFIFLIMFPSVVNGTFLPKLNLITIFSWSMAAILGGCMTYMDRNSAGKKFQKIQSGNAGNFNSHYIWNLSVGQMYSDLPIICLAGLTREKNKIYDHHFTYSSLSVCVCCRCSKHSSGRMAGR